jgi:DNA-binding NtrC family response regulator
MQAMLLRFLETGEIQRVGSDRALPPLDARVIAATHRNLVECVKERTFREDLYYRLNVVHIEVPPLRERRVDIPVLLNHFLSTFSTAHRLPIPDVAADALQRLVSYDWPGNVRELKNVAERLVVGAGSGRIDTTSLPSDLSSGLPRRSLEEAKARGTAGGSHSALRAEAAIGTSSNSTTSATTSASSSTIDRQPISWATSTRRSAKGARRRQLFAPPSSR